MSRALLRLLVFGFIPLAAVTSCVVPSLADDKPADKYNMSGNVLSTISNRGHFYQVASESRIYLLMCTKVKTFQFGEPECKIGDKPIATGDTVHFRIDGDWAYMPLAADGAEEKLRILTTELKVIPALPSAASPANASSANEKGSSPTSEPGIVIGTGLQVKGQHGVGWSTAPVAASPVTTASAATPVVATAPVTAIPVTGGAPVVVMPTGPTTGGVVTGVPVTGGAPIVGIPTAPVMGTPVGGTHAAGGTIMIGGGPQWVHVLRIQTAGKIYQLECSSKPCTLADKEIGLGDTLTLRTNKKHAYLSGDPRNSSAEQEFKILSVIEAGSAHDSEQH
ncbi:MAG: hypothetical protein WAL71_16590 [Terriglobales bacterium]|jgi:hypothetical protein